MAPCIFNILFLILKWNTIPLVIQLAGRGKSNRKLFKTRKYTFRIKKLAKLSWTRITHTAIRFS